MNNIAIVSFGRKKSERCPNKMLRPFAGTTLTDIVLGKIKHFGSRAYFAGYEQEFKEKCLQYKVNFIQRDKRSVTIDGPILDVFGFVRKVKQEKVIFVNPCVPFLSLKAINAFFRRCRKNTKRPTLAVLRRRNYFFNEVRRPLNFTALSNKWNTKNVETVYESANALYFFDKKFFLKNGFYWDWNDVELVEFERTQEFLDIDIEEDFEVAEEIYRARKGKI